MPFNVFQTILKRKTNKIWVDQDSELCESSFTKCLKENEIEIYSTCNEGKSVTAEIFIRTLKSKIYKHMTAVSKTSTSMCQMILLLNAVTHTTLLK